MILVDDFEKHGALVLVEPFCGLVDVIISSGVGTANDLDTMSRQAHASHDERTMTVTSSL